MKIKLVTFAPHANFGTCLQSYAMNYILRKMGHDVEFIFNGRETPPTPLTLYIKMFIRKCIPILLWNWIQRLRGKSELESIEKSNGAEEVPLYILTLPNNYFLSIISKFPFYWYYHRKNYCTTLQKDKVYRFTYEEGNYRMRRLFVKGDYAAVVEDADIFITASDQIWNPYCGGYNPMMFLEFAGNSKRIAYSSSISRSSFPIEIEERAKQSLLKFSHIAVREQSSVEYLSKLLNRNDVKLVVDPTYLLTIEEWTKFAESAVLEFPLPQKYILCYFVGSAREADYNVMVNEVKYAYNINDVITITYHDNQFNFGNGFVYHDGGPHEFIYLIKNAALVCMDSFHATVLALKFSVDFVHILKNKDDKSTSSQNSRMYDVLSHYNLLNKIYDNNSVEEWKRQIDFDAVHKIMNSDIEKSMDYLKEAIEK